MSASAFARETKVPAASSAPDAERFLVLDGLRGIAAFAVIFDHVPGGALGDLIPQRYLSVDFFFVLSGFVLSHAYSAKLQAGWSPLSFMRARFIRLYPLYLAGLLIGLAIAALNALRGWGGDLSEILAIAAFGLFFLPTPPSFTPADGPLYPLNGPSWSLFFELVANLAYALIARFLNWRMLAAILSISAVFVIVTLFERAEVRGPGWLWPHFGAGLARVMFDFFAGIAIYRLHGLVKLPALPWWLVILAFLAVIALPVGESWAAAYDAFAAIVLMPLLVAVAARARVGGAIGKLCSSVGLLSYGVYALHVPIFAVLQTVLPSLHIDPGESPLMVLLVATLAAISAAIAGRIYDKPFRRWLTQLLADPPKREKMDNVTRENN